MTNSSNHFPSIAQALATVCSDLVVETASDLQTAIADGAPVDTGFLASSVYTITSRKSGYGKQQRISKKTGKSWSKKIAPDNLLPVCDRPTDPYTAYVAVGASYGAFVEYGTRRMAAQPFFHPGVEATRPLFEEKARALEGKIKTIAHLP